MTIALKPCPFCGSTKVESCYSGWEYYRVDCESCGTSGPHADVTQVDMFDREAADALACERWNRRAEGDAQRVKDLEDDVARLEEKLHQKNMMAQAAAIELANRRY